MSRHLENFITLYCLAHSGTTRNHSEIMDRGFPVVLYLGNLPRHTTKNDIERHFRMSGVTGITDIKLMNGFDFIELSNCANSRDVPSGKTSRVKFALPSGSMTDDRTAFRMFGRYYTRYSLCITYSSNTDSQTVQDGSFFLGNRLTVSFCRRRYRRPFYRPPGRTRYVPAQGLIFLQLSYGPHRWAEGDILISL
ncbi:hypothetical protein GQ53DRAFT_14997 [Thozetella sp. PMI_491]|nr:hypothetical protein GQ53DRAFT_14997 [Thozetella sp. PMI_491]